MTAVAASNCPVCGLDKPHAHTRYSIALEYREEWLRLKFEKAVIGLGWLTHWKNCLPGSYGMGIHLTKRSCNLTDTYAWWPVEMVWRAFRHGIAVFEPALPDGGVPDLAEALELKEYPFGKAHGPIQYFDTTDED